MPVGGREAGDPGFSSAVFPAGREPQWSSPLWPSVCQAEGWPKPAGPPPPTLRPGGLNHQAFQAAPRARRGTRRLPPGYTLTAPNPAGPSPLPPARRSPHGAGTLCKAKRTYIWRAVCRAGAAPVRSAPLSAAAVLLGRPPSAATRGGGRPAPAGPLAACLPHVISVLGAQPWGGGETGGAGVGRPLCKWNRCLCTKGSPSPALSLAFSEQGPRLHAASISSSGSGASLGRSCPFTDR